MGDGKHAVTSGAAGPATCRPAPVRRGPGVSRSPHALHAPAYRLVPRVVSIPTPRVVRPAGFPWRQGMLCGDGIASVKFSLPERLQPESAGVYVGQGFSFVLAGKATVGRPRSEPDWGK